MLVWLGPLGKQLWDGFIDFDQVDSGFEPKAGEGPDNVGAAAGGLHTIARVAQMLGEDEDWLSDVANEMDQQDGLIWVYGPGDDDGVMAFTDFGIETLEELITIYKADPGRLTPPTDRK